MYTGTNLNESEDAIAFGDYSDRWINLYSPYRDGGLPPRHEAPMLADLAETLADHLAGMGADARPWGWKEPRSIFLLPFLDRHLPSLRFVHFVRDGRDMAFSANQNQLRKHGNVLRLAGSGLSRPGRSMALWSWLNSETVRYGGERLGERYLRVRFEDLCRDPVTIAGRVFEFIGLEGDPTIAREEVAAPDSIGRWGEADADLLAELERIGGPTLSLLGYAGEG